MSYSQFNFKSSGTKKEDRKYTNTRTKNVSRPIGIKTPMEIGDDIFKMHSDPISQLSDNLRNLIMTNYGERLGRYNFGTNLKAVVFDLANSSEFEGIVERQIVDAAEKFIPQIKIKRVSRIYNDNETKNDNNRIGLAKITLRVVFNVPALYSRDLGIEVDLYQGG